MVGLWAAEVSWSDEAYVLMVSHIRLFAEVHQLGQAISNWKCIFHRHFAPALSYIQLPLTTNYNSTTVTMHKDLYESITCRLHYNPNFWTVYYRRDVTKVISFYSGGLIYIDRKRNESNWRRSFILWSPYKSQQSIEIEYLSLCAKIDISISDVYARHI